MRFVLGMMLMGLAVAACEPIVPQQNTTHTLSPMTTPQPTQVAETVDAATELPADGEVSELAETAEEPLPPPDPPMLAQQRAACLREGGQLSPRGAGIYACVMRTSDAGQRCDAAADCQGACLARSGTCSPLTPLFGCQEVFTLAGRRETVCID